MSDDFWVHKKSIFSIRSHIDYLENELLDLVITTSILILQLVKILRFLYFCELFAGM